MKICYICSNITNKDTLSTHTLTLLLLRLQSDWALMEHTSPPIANCAIMDKMHPPEPNAE